MRCRAISAGSTPAGTSHDACGVCQMCVEGRYNICDNYGRPGLHKQYGQALRSHWVAYYRLRRLTLYDFVKNEPIR